MKRLTRHLCRARLSQYDGGQHCNMHFSNTFSKTRCVKMPVAVGVRPWKAKQCERVLTEFRTVVSRLGRVGRVWGPI